MRLQGRVLWASTSNRVEKAYVAVEDVKTGGRKPVELTGEDGDFEFELNDGEWAVTVLHPDGRQSGPKTVQVPDDLAANPNAKIEFPIYSLIRTVSQAGGTWFFALLIVLFFMLIAGWVWTHIAFPDPRPPSIASSLLNLSAEARLALAETKNPIGHAALSEAIESIEAELDPSGTDGLLKEALQDLNEQATGLALILLTGSERVRRVLDDLKSDLERSVPPGQLSLAEAEKAMKDGTKPHESAALAQLIEALGAFEPDEAGLKAKYLGRLQGLIESSRRPDSQVAAELETKLMALEAALPHLAEVELKISEGGSGGFIWSESPKIYLEILFWALAGTLVRLIFVIHQYLRWNRFYKQGIYQHIALLVTVPVLTLVFVLVISMAKLTADDTSVVLDFSDPRIIAGGSFLIALVPWALWERLLGTARKAVGGGEDSD